MEFNEEDESRLNDLGKLLFEGIRDDCKSSLDFLIKAPHSSMDDDIEEYLKNCSEEEFAALKKVISYCVGDSISSFLHKLDCDPKAFGDIEIVSNGMPVTEITDSLQELLNVYEPWLDKGWNNEI